MAFRVLRTRIPPQHIANPPSLKIALIAGNPQVDRPPLAPIYKTLLRRTDDESSAGRGVRFNCIFRCRKEIAKWDAEARRRGNWVEKIR